MKKYTVILVFVALFSFSIGDLTGLNTYVVAVADAKSDSGSQDRSMEEARPEDSQSSEEGRVTLCHAPPGNPENVRTLSVPEAAVAAHLAHGDLLGVCPKDAPGGEVAPRSPSQRNVYGQ